MRQIKVYIDVSRHHGGWDIWITEEVDGADEYYVAKPVKLEFEKVDSNQAYENPQPTLALGHRLARPFLQAFAEALDKHGIKTENDHKIAGILEATKLHLHDMRLLAGVVERLELLVKEDKG